MTDKKTQTPAGTSGGRDEATREGETSFLKYTAETQKVQTVDKRRAALGYVRSGLSVIPTDQKSK